MRLHPIKQFDGLPPARHAGHTPGTRLKSRTVERRRRGEALLLKKYRGIRFYDTDDSVLYEIESSNLEWKKKDKADRRTPCYVILAKAVHGSVSEDGDDSEDESEDEHDAYHINSELHSMISDIRSGHPSNLQLRGKILKSEAPGSEKRNLPCKVENARFFDAKGAVCFPYLTELKSALF